MGRRRKAIVTASQELKIAAPEFRGAALALGSCRDIEVLLDGPAGTGKTFVALYKEHIILSKYPGCRTLVTRKTNTALAGSAIATYRDLIHPAEGIRYFGGNKIRPAAFEYPNGSTLIVNGIDRPEKIKSWEFDRIFVNEATELNLEDWEFCRSRLRHGVAPYHQITGDVNPGPPMHWLNQRCNNGITTRLLSRYEDNPKYWDTKTNDWTEAGREYVLGTLGGLTGVRLSRLRYGIWCSAEGTVYEQDYDRARNVIDPFPIPKSWSRFLIVDFGYTNPFVCLWAAQDEDGRYYIYRQIYRTKVLVEDHAKTIAIMSGWFHLLPKDHPRYNSRPADWADPLPREIICDHDIEDRRTLEKHLGLYTTAAKKSVSDGLQAVASRLRPAGDGRPRVMIFRDSLKEVDPELARMKRPLRLEDEFEMYIWKKGTDGSEKEEPLKENDHALDALRYLCARDLQSSDVSYRPSIWR